MPDTIDSQRRDALALFRQGRLLAAVERQLAVINATRDAPYIADQKQLALMFFTLGDYAAAAAVAEHAHARWPDDDEMVRNAAAAYYRLNDFDTARIWLGRALQRTPHEPAVHDGLASLYGKTGEHALAVEHGEQALRLKDGRASASPLSLTPPSRGATAGATRDVIAFSLWGATERYHAGAVRNAALAEAIYPGWQCRFYCDETVPEAVLGELLAHGAEVVMMPARERAHEGLFWRFAVASDPAVARFLVRDADSLIGIRERHAVDEWLASSKPFHVMRDWYTHTDLVLAGMWGGTGGWLPPLEPHWQAYLDDPHKTPTCDQKFLGEVLWPAIRAHCLVHDRLFRVLGARPFPHHAGTDGERHVGRNEAAVHRSLGTLRAARSRAGRWQRRRQAVFALSSGRSGTRYLTTVLERGLGDAEVHHERTGADGFGRLTPDAAHLMQFNTAGNTRAVREFWRVKLGALSHGLTPVYAEASHFLAKAGLIENLAVLGADVRVDIVALTRDPLATAWSLYNRHDFANRGFTWLFNLDPAYPRNLLEVAPYAAHGVAGHCAWYVREMRARTAYYRRLLADHATVSLHVVDLDELRGAAGIAALLERLGQPPNAAPPPVPAAQNTLVQRPFADSHRAALAGVFETIAFDAEAVAERYLAAGRRLG